MNRTRTILAFGAMAAVAAGFVFLLFWFLHNGETSARKASTKLTVALVRNDPSAAPAGGADYVKGLRAYLGPIRSAKVLGAHNKHVVTGDSSVRRRGRMSRAGRSGLGRERARC